MRNTIRTRIASLTERQMRALCTIGVALTLFGVYVLTNAGRIDIIDGQCRYEVAKNWIEIGIPCSTDPFLDLKLGVDPLTGFSWVNYNSLSSMTPIPFMLLSRALPGHTEERDRFAFSLTSALFGAFGGALLMIGLGMLGVSLRLSALTVGITAFATLWWPLSITTFDQNQHFVWLLATVLMAWHAGRASSLFWAAMAGTFGGLAFNFQENYALLLPALALSVFASAEEGQSTATFSLRKAITRAAVIRYVTFGLCCVVGIVLFILYNKIRYSTPLTPMRYAPNLQLQNNFVEGSLSLLFSPGRSIFVFSPPTALALIGARALFRRAPTFAIGIGLATLIHFLFISSLALFAGEWCWGPRYLGIVALMATFPMPFALARLREKRAIVTAIVTLGLVVQLLALSIDHQRYHFERNLSDYFWLRPQNRWYYFKNSQLSARPGEILDSFVNGLPPEARYFNGSPKGRSTYCTFGPPTEMRSKWVRYFGVFYLPRPWPFWVGRVEKAIRPVDVFPLAAICLVFIASGASLTALALARRKPDAHSSA
jgi:hypothetical protein